jgi:hypothetical protein
LHDAAYQAAIHATVHFLSSNENGDLFSQNSYVISLNVLPLL